MSKTPKLDRLIRKLRNAPDVLRTAGPEIVEAFREEFQQQIARGETPTGEAWQLTQKGEIPLRSAADSLRIGFVGDQLIARLVGPSARHSQGRAKGGIKRQVLPSKLTPRLAKRVRQELAKAWKNA